MGGRTLTPPGYGLSRELWVVQAGVFLNMLGYGAVLPFEIIYLHEIRGFSVGVAGLVVGTATGLAVVAAPFAGSVIDRTGARATSAGAGLALAAGYGGLAFADSPPQAFAAAAVAGIGNGALVPAQAALLTALAPPALRHRAVAVSRVAANVGAGLGGALGGLVVAQGIDGFAALFVANAASYVLYAVILVAAVREEPRPEPVRGGYRLLLRDRPFLRLVTINVAAIAVGWGVFSWVVPPYARAELGAGPQLLGLLLLANALTVVFAQLAVARLAEGRRRAVTLASGSLTFALGCLMVAAADLGGPALADAALVAAAVTFGLGECLHTTVVSPLAADLAPPALRGRYMATVGLSFWLGLALAPTVGTQLLSVWAPAALLLPAGVALATATSALALERRLPAAARLTPRP